MVSGSQFQSYCLNSFISRVVLSFFCFTLYVRSLACSANIALVPGGEQGQGMSEA